MPLKMVYYIKITSLGQWMNKFELETAKDLTLLNLKIKAIGLNQVTHTITLNSNSSRITRRSIFSIAIASFSKNYLNN